MKSYSLKYATAFISSTFSDMKDERNLFMYSVFPRVKKWAFERGIIFDIIDLRWGINEEQAKDLHHTIKICLQRVKDCDPLFLCFLGQRYGWIPDDGDFNSAMFGFDVEKFKNLSATELEIIQALESSFFSSDPKSCLFFFRDDLCLDNAPKDVQNSFIDKENSQKLKNLKERIFENQNVIRYSAELDESFNLTAFSSSEGLLLEDVLFNKITNILAEKYGLDKESANFSNNQLLKQGFLLKYLSLFPQIEECHIMLNEWLSSSEIYSQTKVYIPSDRNIYGQIAQFIQSQQLFGEYKVYYRFIGLEESIKEPNDIICSLAYEMSDDEIFKGDAISSLVYLKNELELREEKSLLILAGIKEEDIFSICDIFAGLKYTRIMLFTETNNEFLLTEALHLTHSDDSFKSLAIYLLAQKGKALSSSQLDTVLSYAHKNYYLLKEIIDYLCTFGTYESLPSIIDELTLLDEFTLTKKHLDSLIEVQNTHSLKGVMADVLELLSNSPLPISREDIMDTIILSRQEKEVVPRDELLREINFSLCFARDYIEEYDGYFKINHNTVKTVMMFNRFTLQNGESIFIPKNSLLTMLLRSVYMSRIYLGKKRFNQQDALNFCEIIKDYSAESFVKIFTGTVIKDEESFFTLARALGKKGLIDLFKTLYMQSLGYTVDSYFQREINRVCPLQDSSLNRAKSISTEKIFSLSRISSPNIFSLYYSAMFSLTDKELSSQACFSKFIREHSSPSTTNCHSISLPQHMKIEQSNTTVYTQFNGRDGNSYYTYLCYCADGFAFICDVFTMELKKAVAIPRDQGKIVSVFYQEHTIHIIYELGVIFTFTPEGGGARAYRFDDGDKKVEFFTTYYKSGYQLTVSDGNSLAAYRAMVNCYNLKFKNGITILSAYAFPTDKAPEKLLVTVKDTQDNHKFYLIDVQSSKITFAFNMGDNKITYSVQNESTGDVYLNSTSGFSYIISYEDGDEPLLDFSENTYHFVSHKNAILSKANEDGVYFNEQLITNEMSSVKCVFASRNIIGFINENNTLYIIDNKY